jgi:hypothetical protein
VRPRIYVRKDENPIEYNFTWRGEPFAQPNRSGHAWPPIESSSVALRHADDFAGGNVAGSKRNGL